MSNYSVLNNLILQNNWSSDLNLKIILMCDYIHILFIQNKTWWANSFPLWIKAKGKYTEQKRLHNGDKRVLAIHSARMSRVPAHHRPFYTSGERFEIIQLRHLYGWSYATTADKFLLDIKTVKAWERKINKNPDSSLICPKVPVNKFSDLVHNMVNSLCIAFPSIGYIRMANIFTRLGLNLSHMTIKRIKERQFPPEDDEQEEPKKRDKNIDPHEQQQNNSSLGVIANYPDHVWHIDITVIPLVSGFLSWIFTNILHTKYPFSWHLLSVIDQYTRRCMHFKLFKNNPTASNVTSFLKEAFELCQSKSKYIISDQGSQFTSKKYKKFLKKKQYKITPRYGAVGKFHSIAFIERFFRSLKDELLPNIIPSANYNVMFLDIADYIDWYNNYRPHQNLDALTPNEKYDQFYHKYTPPPLLDGRKISNNIITLDISYYNDKDYLPIFQLRQAA